MSTHSSLKIRSPFDQKTKQNKNSFKTFPVQLPNILGDLSFLHNFTQSYLIQIYRLKFSSLQSSGKSIFNQQENPSKMIQMIM